MNSVPGDQRNCHFQRDKLDHQIEAIHFHRGREWMVLQRKPFSTRWRKGATVSPRWLIGTDKSPRNVPGPYYNDNTCIDCGICRDIAPEIFHRDDVEAMS